jgi:hypothetical protein
MPNFWSNARQNIYEALAGPRTLDLDFDEKVKELENMYKSVENISNIYKNIQKHTEGLRFLYEDISQLRDIYIKDSAYHESILSIILTFQKLELNYDILVNLSKEEFKTK